MTQNDFTTSPPATDGDATLAADLISDAALAAAHDDRDTQLRVENEARSALDHQHVDVRVSAIGALSRLGSFSTADLSDRLEDPSTLVRRRAVEAAAERVQKGHGDTSTVTVLLAALGDDPSVTEVAAFALGEFGPDTNVVPESAISALEAVASDHPDALCREAAIAALGALHQGRTVVLGAMADKATVRRRAVLALAPFSGDDVDAALDQAVQDRDWQVRQAAEDQITARR